MTEIVEELRMEMRGDRHADLGRRAADEIERLRAALETCRELREYDRRDLHTREQMLIQMGKSGD